MANEIEIVFFNLFLRSNVRTMKIQIERNDCDLETYGMIYKRNVIFRFLFLLRPCFSFAKKIWWDATVLFYLAWKIYCFLYNSWWIGWDMNIIIYFRFNWLSIKLSATSSDIKWRFMILNRIRGSKISGKCTRIERNVIWRYFALIQMTWFCCYFVNSDVILSVDSQTADN